MTRALTVAVTVVAVFVVSGCGGESAATECELTGPLGSGRGEVWLLRPAGDPESIVLFAHGWTAVAPTDWHRPRLDHLCSRASLVVFPRYQIDASDTFEDGVDGFRSGVRTAFAELGDVDEPVVAVGYSFGGALVTYYAGQAQEWNVPVPESVLSIFPTTQVASLPAGTPPSSVDFVVLAGDRDEIVGTGGADDVLAWLERNGRDADYRLIRSTDELSATHEALKETTTASTETFWDPIDELVEAAKESE